MPTGKTVSGLPKPGDRRRRYSDTQLDEITRLRREGWKRARIAEQVGLSPQQVSEVCRNYHV